MLIAVTSTGNTSDSLISEQFGRCAYFMIFNSDTMQYESLANPGEAVQNGAGPKAASTIIENNIRVLLTGNVGDKANEALKRSNIKVFDGFTGAIKVKDAINQYLSKPTGEIK